MLNCSFNVQRSGLLIGFNIGGCIQQLNTLKKQQSVSLTVKMLLGWALIRPMWTRMLFIDVRLCVVQYADFSAHISGG